MVIGLDCWWCVRDTPELEDVFFSEVEEEEDDGLEELVEGNDPAPPDSTDGTILRL